MGHNEIVLTNKGAMERHESPPQLGEQAKAFAGKSKAENTKIAYSSDWADFTAWCAANARQPLPASSETIADYAADMAQRLKASTISRRLSAIRAAHKIAGFGNPADSPIVDAVLEGISRALGTAPSQKTPALTEDIKAMVDTLDDSLLGQRDRAMLLVGFAGAFRRSELIALNAEDVTESRDGLTIFISRSKTDQEGKGRFVGIPYGSNPATCPVRAFQDWKRASGIITGSLWRVIGRKGELSADRLTTHAVARIIKRCAERAGLDPANYSGHSLRAGLVTSAAKAGVRESDIMRQTGHKSHDTLKKYIRKATLFEDNAAAKVGL